MEYDLISVGLRLDDLGTRGLSWRDLWVVVRQSPRGSALDRELNPDEWQWGLAEHLHAVIYDALRVGIWQRGEAKKADFPDPTPRPGVKPRGNRIGGEGLPMHEMAKALGWADEEAEV